MSLDNKENFSQIVNNYTLPLYKRANYLLSNSEDAEDIVQEVFLVAYKSYKSYEGKSSIKTWLTGILNNKISDYYRKKYKSAPNISLDHYFDDEGSWKLEHTLTDWQEEDTILFNDLDFKEIFDDCINKLPTKWSMPFKMYYLESQKTELLSQEFGLSTTNIWKILQRGRLQLKECLEKNWFNKD